MKKPKYGMTLHTNYRLNKEEYMYIAYMILIANFSIGIGLAIGLIIALII